MWYNENMNNECKWLQETKDGVVLTVKAVPRAAKSEIAGVDDEWLRVRVKAPPVDGKANEALVKFFAEFYSLPKGSVSIVSGDTARLKRIRITGLAADKAKEALSAARP